MTPLKPCAKASPKSTIAFVAIVTRLLMLTTPVASESIVASPNTSPVCRIAQPPAKESTTTMAASMAKFRAPDTTAAMVSALSDTNAMT